MLSLNQIHAAIAISAIVVFRIAVVPWQRKRTAGSDAWPQIEAVIVSGGREVVTGERSFQIELPVFAFSYQAGEEYYSGRFALLPHATDPTPGITERLVGRKIPLRYDPRDPAVWIITEDMIEGCQVQQKPGASLSTLFPRS
jgi:hypothetical protein